MGDSKFVKSLILCGIFIFLASCGHKEESAGVVIYFDTFQRMGNLKNKSSLDKIISIDTISIDISNIEGERLGSLFWLRSHPEEPFQNEFSLEVPRGDKRQFQVLVMAKTESGDTIMYYGSKIKDILNSQETVAISLEFLSKTSRSGILAGRYLSGVDKGHTSQVNQYLSIEGRPEILGFKSRIDSGFFHFLNFEEMESSYRLPEGSSLFEKVRSSSEKILATEDDSHQTIRVHVPKSYTDRVGVKIHYPKRLMTFGFYGRTSTESGICYPQTEQMISNLYVNSSLSENLKWSGSNPSDLKAHIQSVLIDGKEVIGGVNDCAKDDSSLYKSLLYLDLNGLKSSHALGFRGPFRKISDATASFLKIIREDTETHLKWKLLNEAKDNYSSLTLYYKDLSLLSKAAIQNEERLITSSPYFFCESLFSMGFESQTLSVDTNSIMLPNMPSPSAFVLCPNASGRKVRLESALITYQKSDESAISCPGQHWVYVPANSDLNTDPFCVMKYEAKALNTMTDSYKEDGGFNSDTHWANEEGEWLPSSVPEHQPWVNVSANDAKTFCGALGPGYDLISNPQWQALARNIELMPTNWEDNDVGESSLNRGHSSEAPESASSLPASEDDNNACYGYTDGRSCDLETWHINRRIHFLSTGDIIWDIAGNVWSWVDWTTGGSLDVGPKGCTNTWMEIPDMPDGCGGDGGSPTLNKAFDLFPTNDSLTSANGVGGGKGGSNGCAIRGGRSSSGWNAGIFSLELNHNTTQANGSIGFRCVFMP